MTSIGWSRPCSLCVPRPKTWPPPPPGGWEHLPLALVDTTFSLNCWYEQSRTDVFRPVARYAHFAEGDWACRPARWRSVSSDPPEHTHTLSEMLQATLSPRLPHSGARVGQAPCRAASHAVRHRPCPSRIR